MSYQIAYDVRNTRASTWRGTFNSAHSLPPPASTRDNGESAPQLTRKRSIGPVWCDHDRKVSALLDAGLQRPAPEPRRRQNEAIPIPESLDANGLHRSQAWDFQASPDVREDRVKMRLAKVQQYTQEHLLDCKIAGMGPCQAGWRMGYEHTGDCPRPALPDGAFCAIHTCTANGRDNERCLNHVPDPFKLSNQGLPRICRSGYHVENNQANKLDHAIALNAAILAKEAEEAPQRELEHLQRYAEITGETEAADGYSIYTQLNGTIRRKSDGGLKPSALDLTAASRRPSFSEPTPLWTSRSSSAESSRLRTPTTPLPAKEWPLYTLDAALLKVQLDTACSVVKRDTITAAPLTDSPAMLEPSPVLRQAPVIPAKKNVAGLSIEVISVTGHGVDSPISPSPSNIQLRRGSLSPIAAKPALPTVEECEEGHATPQRSSAATSPAAAPITITRSRLALSSSPLTAAHLTVGDARSNTSAYLSTSPCSAISQLQIVLGQAKRTPATSVSIDRTSFTSTAASASSQYLTAASTSSQQASMTSSTSSGVEGEVEVVMPRLSVATGDDVLTVKERVAARKAADGRSSNMARIMRGRMGDGFMHRSAWGRTQQMDEDLLAIQAE